MPMYDFQCQEEACHHTFDRMVRLSEFDEVQPCPECGADSKRLISKVGVVLKGDGWASKNGRIAKALPFYDRAVSLDPQSALLRRELARVQIEMNDPALLQAATVNLKAALSQDRSDGFSWRQLAIAQGKLGNMGESSLAMAEEAMVQGKIPDAKYHAGRAEKLLPSGSVGWLQAQDILQSAENAAKP